MRGEESDDRCDSKNVGRKFIGRRTEKRNLNNEKVDVVVDACWILAVNYRNPFRIDLFYFIYLIYFILYIYIYNIVYTHWIGKNSSNRGR